MRGEGGGAECSAGKGRASGCRSHCAWPPWPRTGSAVKRCVSRPPPPARPPARSIHPGPAGHQVLAELLAGLLQRAAAEVAAGLVPARRADARLEGLPPPMAPNYEDHRSSLCLQLVSAGRLPAVLPAAAAVARGRRAGSWGRYLLVPTAQRCCLCPAAVTALGTLPYLCPPAAPPQRDFKAVVRRQRGWEYRPERPQLERWVEQKWGWSALEPGAPCPAPLPTPLPITRRLPVGAWAAGCWPWSHPAALRWFAVEPSAGPIPARTLLPHIPSDPFQAPGRSWRSTRGSGEPQQRRRARQAAAGAVAGATAAVARRCC